MKSFGGYSFRPTPLGRRMMELPVGYARFMRVIDDASHEVGEMSGVLYDSGPRAEATPEWKPPEIPPVEWTYFYWPPDRRGDERVIATRRDYYGTYSVRAVRRFCDFGYFSYSETRLTIASESGPKTKPVTLRYHSLSVPAHEWVCNVKVRAGIFIMRQIRAKKGIRPNAQT